MAVPATLAQDGAADRADTRPSCRRLSALRATVEEYGGRKVELR